MGVLDQMYEGGGAKPFSFRAVGDCVEGPIESIRTKQLTEFGTDRPETWPNGDAKMTPIVTVKTDRQEEADDDGRRDLYLRAGAFSAFGQALREAYPSKPGDSELIGATLKIQFHATEPSRYGTPRKMFRAKITPSSSGAVFDAAWDQPGGAQAPPAAPLDADVPF